MKPKQKLKPFAAFLSIESPENVEVDRWNTELTPLHVQDGLVVASGALLNPSGRSVGVININGIPVANWPQGKPVGRPAEREKHLAIFLAWCLSVCRWKDKYGLADQEVCEKFKYSEASKIRKIRIEQAKRHGISLEKNTEDIFYFFNEDEGEGGNFEATVMIKKPTWYQKDEGFEVLGLADIWMPKFGEKVSTNQIMVEVAKPDSGFDFKRISERNGRPIIISSLQPGRKQISAL